MAKSRASVIGIVLLAALGATGARAAVFDPTFGIGGIASDPTVTDVVDMLVEPGTGRIIASAAPSVLAVQNQKFRRRTSLGRCSLSGHAFPVG
jgi:hypothetical protein